MTRKTQLQYISDYITVKISAMCAIMNKDSRELFSSLIKNIQLLRVTHILKLK